MLGSLSRDVHTSGYYTYECCWKFDHMMPWKWVWHWHTTSPIPKPSVYNMHEGLVNTKFLNISRFPQQGTQSLILDPVSSLEFAIIPHCTTLQSYAAVSRLQLTAVAANPGIHSSSLQTCYRTVSIYRLANKDQRWYTFVWRSLKMATWIHSPGSPNPWDLGSTKLVSYSFHILYRSP